MTPGSRKLTSDMRASMALVVLIRDALFGRGAFVALVRDVLCGGDGFLMGLHNRSRSTGVLYRALLDWARLLNRNPADVMAGVESCIRQNVLMSLIPNRAVDPLYAGSIDVAVEEHLANLAITLSDEERLVLRNVCFHIRKYHGLDRRKASKITTTLAELRGMHSATYKAIRTKQKDRCCWCGVLFGSTAVVESIEHMSPKVIGDDPPDGTNWGLACKSCNTGKAESLSWATQAAAQDYLQRAEFDDVSRVGLAQRWAVLARAKRCDACGSDPRKGSLWVYRRVKTGLPIPSHCSVTCGKCGAERRCELLTPRWDPAESGRTVPSW
jgi:hypothetical protein